ncbi:5-guanidino-2-oxopentanoate decarboxylase [Aestuariicella hydrocarbonica]|uniref:5-guanidino-2-oxopentanoate decarboxylase n=1 Tax=Pseudomaricurvus hydrocarbonicus TaxID=1470433 RepID=A0A9E5MM96_9GAMM|nr:5-guanidino-2-oxopentanoate decarboxylase [Aestuariicella hydrocarbonica]NHO65780.1 5-guanidino-2-oxopentanoate decarboxylase [Aestuariicella hydrocarbonica]
MATCGEVLIKMLENYGVNTVFGIPGVHTVELYRGLASSHIRHITPRHEQGAGFMADGYARASGTPGVCFIITGPGMTNIATAMGQALQDSIPMLVISSVNRRGQLGMGEGFLHELPDQGSLVSEVSRFSHQVRHLDQLPKVLARAFAVFNSERPGPVHIEIPIDVITEPADHVDVTCYPIPRPPAPAPDDVARAIDILRNANRPLIVIGGGAVNAGTELLVFAEKLNCPIVNTVNAKGVVPYSHPLVVGGSGSCEAIRDEMQNADVVLAVGTEFSETDYDFFFAGPIKIDGELIRVDIDPSQLSRNVKPTLAICSDAQEMFVALARDLPETAVNADGQTRAQALKRRVRTLDSPRYADFFATIRETLPDVLIAGDSTQPVYYAWLFYETEQPRRYFHSASGFGTLGYAIPAAMGAKLGRPDLPVIGLIGDGAAQFSIGELASAVEAQVPVIFLLWNNSGYGEIRRFMDDAQVDRVGVDIYTPDFQMIGKGFGCATTRASNREELATQLLAASVRSGPSLIEVAESDFADGYPFP